MHRGNRRLLLVQHTITARKGLRRKWLDEKEGDVCKAIVIFEKEIACGAIRDATLVLTCTTDPDEKLIRDVHATTDGRLKIDIWSASRIADFLDRHPEGQWLRKQQFGTDASRLSAAQARAISKLSLDDYLPLVPRSETVSRSIDAALAQFVREKQGTGFVIGESGTGKSVALRRTGDEWFANGGIVLVLPHESIEQAGTIEQAIGQCLRHWAPELELTCGNAVLSHDGLHILLNKINYLSNFMCKDCTRSLSSYFVSVPSKKPASMLQTIPEMR